jgi:small-conductance mechanosensitive channel
MLFLFVEHAFDVGDLLEVELVTYRVKKIDLMYTVSGCVQGLVCVVDCWQQQQLHTHSYACACPVQLTNSASRTSCVSCPVSQVLVKSSGERCYYPNTRLITLPVVNLTRSVARSEKVVISLNVGQASNAAREALLVRRGGRAA